MIRKVLKKLLKPRNSIIKSVYIPMIQGDFLRGKTALVTGGTSGIGRSTATAFARCGCETVVITGRNQKRCDEIASQLSKSTGRQVVGVAMDQTRPEEIERVFPEILRLVDNKLDILYNNAGIYDGTDYEKVTPELFDSVMETNMKSSFFLTQAVSEHMIANKIEGSICNLCSSSSFRPAIDPYMISKWGMRGFTLGLAKKLIKHGIVVNGIAPGPTSTPMLGKDADSDIFHPTTPSGRYSTPEEVANLAVFLVSNMGRQIVGEVISISGGAAVTTYDDVNNY